MPTNSLSLLREYVKALIDNANIDLIPKEIDLVFDGGAFNGFFAWGIGLYLRELVGRGVTKVNRVSGCSVGSIIALLYVLDADEDMENWFKVTVGGFKDDHNCLSVQPIIREFVKRKFPDDDMSQINGRLYISYYDVEKCKQRVISTFRNGPHLVECILRSSHLPYMSDGNVRRGGKYIDGISPFIFPQSKLPVLFVSLMTKRKFLRSVIFKNEANVQFRILSGVADANEFFAEGRSDMCSYVRNWSMCDILKFRVRDSVTIRFIFPC